MKRMRLALAAVMAIGLVLAAGSAWANNLRVTNVTVVARDATTADVKFDISWENSWRYTNINHDAAWVFFKVQKFNSTVWTNVTLEGSGTNPPNYSIGTGTGIELLVPTDRVGMFVRRSASAEGSGPVSVTNVKAVWNIASNGLVMTDKVKMQALAVEMVYVAEGPFWAGNTNGIISASFHAQGNDNSPVYIASTNAFTIYWDAGDGNNASIPSAFPNGFAAFYCMKYELTQGQYTDFLNLLTPTQASSRWSAASTGGRGTIGTNTVGVFTNTRPDRPCNFLKWADGCAFTDWAGMRPMTELEYEKACRGPLPPVNGEYAWGTTTIVADIQLTVSKTPEDGTETITTDVSMGAALYGQNNLISGDGGQGPLRSGIFATASSSRQAAGASYWGIMEMSGNLTELYVTAGTGCTFTGLHGDGCLDGNGNANVSLWPPITGLFGQRGMEYRSTSPFLRVSDRAYAIYAGWWGTAARDTGMGWRAGRTAPSGVGP